MIDKNTEQRIKEAAKIYDVVSDYVKLRKTGARYTGLCPFHKDTNDGNFIVYPKMNVFKCFKCDDKKGGPIEFLMMHEGLSYVDALRWLGKKYHIETDMNIDYKPTPVAPPPPPLPTLTLPFDWVKDREHWEGDNLVAWINTGVSWDCVQRARIDDVLHAYHVGHTRSGMTLFWQIDDTGHVRTGKMMRYNKDGHRCKGDGYNRDWIHAALARPVIVRDVNGYPIKDENGNVVKEVRNKMYYDEDKQMMRQCLFGLHLLDFYKRDRIQQDVCIVESEKTALLMAIAYGNGIKQVWMACGGLQNLSREMIQPLINQRRRIILYPDKDGIEKWRVKAEQLHYDKLTVETKQINDCWKEEDGPTADIADVVVRMINEKKIYKTAEEVVEDLPVLKALHEKLNLEVIK